MTAFLIADIKVTDDKWVPDYAASVHVLVHKHGGKVSVAQRQCKDVGRRAAKETSLIAIMAFPSVKASRILRYRSRLHLLMPQLAGTAAKAAFN